MLGGEVSGQEASPYETEAALCEYLLFHYGSEEETLSLGAGPRDGLRFAVRTVTELADLETLPATGASAFDIGCAVGRSSFELSRFCDEVTGLDFSESFVNAAEMLKRKGELKYRYLIQGERFADALARVSADARPEKVTFVTGDACDLSPALGAFHLVHAANLLCRLPEPEAFLRSLSTLIRPGGQLLLATPFTWLDSFTPRDKWLGGQTEGPTSFETLCGILEADFRLDHEADLPFLLREHERKFQYGVSKGMRWRRLES